MVAKSVPIDMPGRTVLAKVWRARAVRDSVLLDTNVPENSDADRDITHQLYGGDRDMRIKQEMVLGVGGVSISASWASSRPPGTSTRATRHSW